MCYSVICTLLYNSNNILSNYVQINLFCKNLGYLSYIYISYFYRYLWVFILEKTLTLGQKPNLFFNREHTMLKMRSFLIAH